MNTDDEFNIRFVPPGRLRCVITGRLRADTPEENVRQRVARSLIDHYGYDKADIAVEFTVHLGQSRRRIDLAVFLPGRDHTPENVYIVIECKREDVRPTDADNGVEQLRSYMAACPNCRFGMWVGSELQVWERSEDASGVRSTMMVTDIPRFGFDAPPPPTFGDLLPANDDLVAVFRRCHNYIYGNQGLQKEPAFNEFLKLIFCKVQDEDDIVHPLRFYIDNKDRLSPIGQRRLRNAIDEFVLTPFRQRYPYIFADETALDISNPVLAYIVGEFATVSR